MSTELWQKAATTIVNAGQFPIPVNDTMLELVQTIIDENHAEFIQIFDKPLNMDEIRERSGFDEISQDRMLDELMNKGVIISTPSKRSGLIIYRLMPPLPGLFEYTLMRGETGETEKKLAVLFDRIFGELSSMVQDNYDDVVELFKSATPITRVVPIGEVIEPELDVVLPHEEVTRIVEKFDTIAVAHCYCRHEKQLLGKTCQTTSEVKNCLLFGQTAKFVIERKFGDQISKDRAKEILHEARDAGLVHKAFHMNNDPDRDEYAICNCCKCCCGTFELYYRGAAPMQTYATRMAAVEIDDCDGCEECIDRCPMEAIEYLNDAALVDEQRCIGCGVCSYHCSTEAIKMVHTGKRQAFVLPPRLN